MHYGALSDQDKERKAIRPSDLCTITYDDQVDWFIRVGSEIPFHGVTEPFMWGIWVSLSAPISWGNRTLHVGHMGVLKCAADNEIRLARIISFVMV
jgi:Uncharacterized protein conserved in bacteria (DUF2199)